MISKEAGTSLNVIKSLAICEFMIKMQNPTVYLMEHHRGIWKRRILRLNAGRRCEYVDSCSSE